MRIESGLTYSMLRTSPKAAGFDFVYAIRCGKRFVKVGRSSDIGRRLRGMSTHNPFRLTIERCLSVERHIVDEVERWMHIRLKKQRMHCEWFAATPKTIGIAFDEALRNFDRAHECDEWRGVTSPGELPSRYDRHFFEPTPWMEGEVLGPSVTGQEVGHSMTTL